MQLQRFKVTNYRNVLDSGWIDTRDITAFVGQNEAGKSNLFEALYRINPFAQGEMYDISVDWPVDDWGNKDASAIVCQAEFSLDEADIASLFDTAQVTETVDEKPEDEEQASHKREDRKQPDEVLPTTLTLVASRSYEAETVFSVKGDAAEQLDHGEINTWAQRYVPKFVLIQDYGLNGTQIELDSLAARLKQPGWDQLTNDEQTIKIVLDLAQIDIDSFLEKGQTAEGRTTRSFDKRSASAYLSKQFSELWTQKEVSFDIEIDGTTLNIFATDKEVGMPVRLNMRSSGFRWHVSFAWKFTHASKGQYEGCILLLEEPGIHSHHSGQRDLLEVFERLSETNTILYTTHLASMVDLAYPERIRIVETHQNHTTVKAGVVSSQRAPMAVIELSLGLTGDMGGLLGTRQTLIVEGGDDALILHKLSGVLREAGKTYLSDRIYLWPAHGATKTPMYAAFAVGQNWDSGVLLDTDAEGNAAKNKITELTLQGLSKEQQSRFRVFMLGKAAGIKKTDAAIEDLFDDEFYVDCVNAAYRVVIDLDDLPKDGSDMITKRVEKVLQQRYGQRLDKRRVFDELLDRFDGWSGVSDLPGGTASRAEKLFAGINRAFENKDGTET